MKRWFILAFVFLLCAAYPAHAAVYDLSTEVGLTVGSENGWVDYSDTSVVSATSDYESAAVITRNGSTNSMDWGSSDPRGTESASLSFSSGGNDAIFWSSSILTYQQVNVSGTLLDIDLSDFFLGGTTPYTTMSVELVYGVGSAASDDSVLGALNLWAYAGSTGFTGVNEGEDYEPISLGDAESMWFMVSVDYDAYMNNALLSGTVNFNFTDGTPTDPGPDPVPEPSTMILLGCGLLGFARSRKNKRQ